MPNKKLSNEEIRKKREIINKKLLLIHKLIQEGRFSDAKRVANDIIKKEKHIKPE